MFCSNIELFWYEFRIRKNVEKKCFGKCSSEQQTAYQMNVATDNVTSQCLNYVKLRQIFG